jgi:titin
MHSVTKYSQPSFRLVRILLALLFGNLASSGWGTIIMVTNTANSGPGSFQQALLTANANPGLDTINFQIPGTPPFTIAPTAALPAITDPVIIDATTQPGFAGKPVVEINGAATLGLGQIAGLKFSSGASTLRGLAINRFPIQLIELDSASNNIQGNYLGTDVTGTLAHGSGSGSDGIYVKSAGNVIGGTNSGDGNVIAGGNDTGIYLQNANNNIVLGNLIGLNAAGTGSLSNVNNGIVIYASSGNVIGGPVPAARNIISGNGASGIYLTGVSTTGNLIQGNRIGTDISGSNIVSNVAGDGITLISAPGNLISSNLISGNGLAGVSISGASATGNALFGNNIGTDATGQTNLGNHLAGVTISGAGGQQIGGPNVGNANVISGNVLDGIALTGGTATNLIQGNLIGLAAGGTSALRNGQNGISISGGTSNIIGGVTAGARNFISGNTVNGISILLLSDSGNTVLGNDLGTDVTGTKAIANALAGVRIQGCSNTVGGVVTGAGNVISGNGQQGVYLQGTNGSVTGNLIQGNIIGLDVSGANSLGNGDAGVGITSAAKNQVGGSSAAARNILSANAGEGIYVIGTGASNNIVQGNYIGTDATGMVAHGNSYEGITIQIATATQIGGTTVGAGNVISANNNRGIYLTYASGTVIQANFIGTKVDGTSALGNLQHGIDIDVGSSNNIVGGTAAGAGNVLAFAQTFQGNGYCGVRVRDGAYNNLISGNSTFSNNGLGIDLSTYGVTLNYACESGMSASAANAGQNFPTLSNVYSGTLTRIRGTMNGQTGKTYTLQFFASPTGDPSGYGEGQVYLGQTNLTLGATCSSSFTAYLPVAIQPGWVVTATATDANNNTSEFSAWVSAIPVPPVQLAQPAYNQLALSWTNNGGSFALQQTASLTPPVSWSAVTNQPVLQNNFLVATLGLTNSSVFYRLTAP